jgi:hypothetical protein
MLSHHQLFDLGKSFSVSARIGLPSPMVEIPIHFNAVCQTLARWAGCCAAERYINADSSRL